MKILFPIFLLIVSSLNFFSCNKQPDYSKIKVGMTYDEVETILGKPISITRGANEFDYNFQPIDLPQLYSLNINFDPSHVDSARWISPPSIKTIGNLIYVTWIYNKTKIDSHYILIDKYKTVKDTNYMPGVTYYLGNIQVSKKLFDDSDGYLYKSYDGTICDKALYRSFVESKLFKMPNPVKVEKRIIKTSSKYLSNHSELEKTERINYIVNYLYCVVFDAASGRVTSSDYFPINIHKKNNTLN